MKRLSRLVTGLVLGALVLTMAGCEDDLVQNPDFINPDTFYKDNAALEKGVNGVYANLGGENGGGEGRWFNWFYDRFVFEERVGYQVGWEKGPLAFQTGTETPSSGYIQAFWEISYQSINRANGAIEAARQLEGEVQDPEKRERLMAEAQFLRGFLYYYLAAYFADGQQGVPLTTERTSGTTSPQMASKSEIVQRVIDDASAAASNLPSTYEGANKGRATKWAAKTLLMKAHLMRGSMGNSQGWSNAASVAEDIMQNSPHSLYDDFINNWEVAHENEYTGGRIFEGQVSASADAAQYSNAHAHFVPPDHEFGQGWHWLWTTKKFRMRYDADDERIPGTFLQSYESVRPDGATPEDPVTVEWSADAPFEVSRFGGVVADGADPSNPDNLEYGGGWSRKWVENCGSRGCWNSTEKNIPYFRYADVLLGHSEACLEGASCDALSSLNTLRDKRGLSDLSVSGAELRDSLVVEWMKEFAFEQKGFIFLKRKSSHNGSKKDYLAQWINDFGNTYNVDRSHREEDHIIPVPQREVNSNPNVSQHPIWQ